MKRIFSLSSLTAAAVVLLGSVVSADHVDFAGSWSIDKSQTTLNSSISDVTLILTQEGILMTVVNRITSADGQTRESKSTYKTDGQAESTTVTQGAMAGPLTQKATWTDGGKSLTIEQDRTITRDGQEIKLHIVNVWSLSEDKKTLTIETKQESPMGTRKAKQVYHRN